jgi:DNA-binding MarR family transcriptional regulator
MVSSRINSIIYARGADRDKWLAHSRNCIGVDDAFSRGESRLMDEANAERVTELYRGIYTRLHARRARGEHAGSEATAVMQHLERTGPLTVGEAAAHFHRAQSATSELLERLERRGLVERMRDARDRRRALVWLTKKGFALLRRQEQVLSAPLVERALAAMPARDRRRLVEGMSALLRAADTLIAKQEQT